MRSILLKLGDLSSSVDLIRRPYSFVLSLPRSDTAGFLTEIDEAWLCHESKGSLTIVQYLAGIETTFLNTGLILAADPSQSFTIGESLKLPENLAPPSMARVEGLNLFFSPLAEGDSSQIKSLALEKVRTTFRPERFLAAVSDILKRLQEEKPGFTLTSRNAHHFLRSYFALSEIETQGSFVSQQKIEAAIQSLADNGLLQPEHGIKLERQVSTNFFPASEEELRNRVFKSSPGESRSAEKTNLAEFLHQKIVIEVTTFLKEHHIEPLMSSSIDIYVRGHRIDSLIEVKSSNSHNFQNQIEKAIFQVLLYREGLPIQNEPQLAIIIGHPGVTIHDFGLYESLLQRLKIRLFVWSRDEDKVKEDLLSFVQR